jgi:hypothetical protein
VITLSYTFYKAQTQAAADDDLKARAAKSPTNAAPRAAALAAGQPVE